MPVSKNVAIVWQKETRISIGAARVLACSAKFDPNTSKPNMNPTAARNNEMTMWWNCEASNKQSQSVSMFAMAKKLDLPPRICIPYHQC